MTEVAPGIHRIEGGFAGRLLAQHVLLDKRLVLVDTGAAPTPEELLFPALADLARDPSDIDYVVCTHPDTDHCGGNSAVRRAAPRCRFLGHCLDARWLEDPVMLIAERYDGLRADHGVHEADEALLWLAEQSGAPVALDLRLCGGEGLVLGEDWEVTLLHTPGHSEGHMSVWDARSSTLIIADAALGAVVPDADGRPAEAPTYTHPGPYLASIAALRALPFERLLTTHFPLMDRDQGLAFLEESEQAAHRLAALPLDAAARSDDPFTLIDLVDMADARCPLPAGARASWAQPLSGHLCELEDSGLATRVPRPGHATGWRLTRP